MTAADPPFRAAVAEHVATITLHRPRALNAIDLDMLEGLSRLLAGYHDDPEVRAVVITGAGRAFCAGGDLAAINAIASTSGEGFRYGAGVFHQLVLAMRALPKPIIAAINGVAAGGGMSLALACDVRIMADDAFMQVGYLGRGLSTDGGLSHSLPRLVGAARAFELAVTDERIDAARCLALGLVGRVCPAGGVLAAAQELAARLASGPAFAIGRSKALFMASGTRTLAEQLEHERVAIAECAASPEGREGLQSFLDKRRPDFYIVRPVNEGD